MSRGTLGHAGEGVRGAEESCQMGANTPTRASRWQDDSASGTGSELQCVLNDTVPHPHRQRRT